MKGFRLLLLSFLFMSAVSAQESNPSSKEDIVKEACEQAGRENKNVFIIFHASWCGWCHKMDTAMNDPVVKDFFSGNYIIRHLVVLEFENKKHLENPGAEAFLKKYKGEGQGIPYWIIFDKNGKWLADSKIRPRGGGLEAGDNTGCPANEKEVAHFIEVLQKTSALDSRQLTLIEKRFRENADQ